LEIKFVRTHGPGVVAARAGQEGQHQEVAAVLARFLIERLPERRHLAGLQEAIAFRLSEEFDV